MNSIGKVHLHSGEVRSGGHVDSDPPSSTSSVKDGVEKPLDMDVEKSAPSNDNNNNNNDNNNSNNNNIEKNDAIPRGQDPSVFPDGGFEAWFAVAGGFCTIFASFGWINCMFRLWIESCSLLRIKYTNRSSGIGIFQDYYETNQLKAYNPSTVSWIPSTESFMLFFWVSFILHIFHYLSTIDQENKQERNFDMVSRELHPAE
jgi:hypothetical protein